MRSSTAYKLITLFGLCGALFSGYLSYFNYFKEGCSNAIVSCSGGGNAITIFGQPSCIYGLAMFTVMLIIGLYGWSKMSGKKLMTAALIIGLVGTLFSGTLSVLELWFRTPRPTTLPACVYGGIIYLALLIVSWFGWRGFRGTGTDAPVQNQSLGI
jgi:uncharacterized membrane protein